MELGQLFQTFQDSVVVASSKFGLFLLDIITFEDETPSSSSSSSGPGAYTPDAPQLHLGIFYMPQICDMGPTALLPLWRKADWGFFHPEKSWRLRPGLNPRTWVLKGPIWARNVGNCLPNLMVSYPRRMESLGRTLWKPENLRVLHIFHAIKNIMNKIKVFNSYFVTKW